MSKKDTQQIKEMKAKLLHMAAPVYGRPEFKRLARSYIEMLTIGKPDREYCIRKLLGFILGKNGVHVKRARRNPCYEFYSSEAWRVVRYDALAKSRGRCALCGASPATGAVLHVDHIKPRYLHPELELEPSNLQVLCQDCNLGKGAGDDSDWRQPEDECDAHWKTL